MVSASSESDLYNQLQTAGLELVDCASLDRQKVTSAGFLAPKVKIRDLIQFFQQLYQLQGAGVQMLDALSDVRDSAGNQTLRDAISDIARDVSDGMPLSGAMGKHPKIFNKLHTSMVAAGEQTGDLVTIYGQLITYSKWVDLMQAKIKKATRYPMIVSAAVVLMLVVMMGYVVPQIVGFIQNLDQDIPFYTTALIATSGFFQKYAMHVLLVPPAMFLGLKYACKFSNDLAYRVDSLVMITPVIGPIIRKITIARYAQTFGVLYASGLDVIASLRSAKETVMNRAMLEALDSVEAQVKAGKSLSEAFEACGEFPMMVVRMLRVGEESGDLQPVLDQICEFYTKDVDEAVEGLVAIIEPALTAVMGIMILWIAVAVFGPIYGSFENIEM